MIFDRNNYFYLLKINWKINQKKVSKIFKYNTILKKVMIHHFNLEVQNNLRI